MAIEINTTVKLGNTEGRKLGNMLLEDAKFFGRPNFSGLEDQFKDERRKFTVLIPNSAADDLRAMGWNVKTDIPTQADLAQYPDRETLSHMRVMVDDSSDIYLRVNDVTEKLAVQNYGAIDRSRIDSMDMEIRAWEYNPDEKPGQYSARLVALVANIQQNMLEQKWGQQIR